MVIFRTLNFFVFSIAIVKLKLAFGHCKNSRTVNYLFLLGFSFMTKGRLGAAVQNGSTKNFETKCCGYLTKNVTLQFILVIILSFVPEKPHVDPKNIVFGMGWTCIAGSTWDFSDAKHNSHTNSADLMLRVLLGIQKKRLKIFGQNRIWCTTLKSCFLDKNPGRLHVTFLSFHSGQKLVQHRSNKKKWTMTFNSLCARASIPSNRRVALHSSCSGFCFCKKKEGREERRCYWVLADGPAPAGSITREAGILGYNEICGLVKSGELKRVMDPEMVSPYAYGETMWVGYDDEESIRRKV